MSSSDTNIIDTKQSEKSNNRKRNDTPSDGRTSIRYLRELNKYDRTKSDNTILIAGFLGPGLVGSIGANYIIEKLDMHQIAFIDSEFIVPGVIYIGGKLRHPFRLYMNEQADIYVLECEAPIMMKGVPPPNRQPIILSSDNKGLGEMPENTESHDVENNTNNDKILKRTIQKRMLENAYIGGISGGLLSACLSNEIPF